MLLRAFSMLVAPARSSLVIQRLLFTRLAETKSAVEFALEPVRKFVLELSNNEKTSSHGFSDRALVIEQELT